MGMSFPRLTARRSPLSPLVGERVAEGRVRGGADSPPRATPLIHARSLRLERQLQLSIRNRVREDRIAADFGNRDTAEQGSEFPEDSQLVRSWATRPGLLWNTFSRRPAKAKKKSLFVRCGLEAVRHVLNWILSS